MNGKGSSPRPFEVSHEVFASNWDAIFKKGNHVFQQETQDTNGTPEAASIQQGRNDSSDDCSVPADNQSTL